jgi:hypothetical protein
MPDEVKSLTEFSLILQGIARVGIATTYFPQPTTYKVVFKSKNGQKEYDATVYVDPHGLLVSGQNTAAIPLRARMDNVASDANLRSQIANAKSSP